MKLSDYKNTDEYIGIQASKTRSSKAIVADYTVDPTTDEQLVVAATASDIVITLPTLASLAGRHYQVLEIVPIIQNGFKITVTCQGSDTFTFGGTFIDIPRAQKEFELGLHEHGFNLRRNITVSAHYHRDAAWNAANFATETAVPFDVESSNSQPELIVWDGAGKVTLNVSGEWDVSYGLDIDSTGGSTWNVFTQLYKNGVAVPHINTRTGNYGNEDQSTSMIPVKVEVSAGDYLELKLDQNNLTGDMVGVTFNVGIRL